MPPVWGSLLTFHLRRTIRRNLSNVWTYTITLGSGGLDLEDQCHVCIVFQRHDSHHGPTKWTCNMSRRERGALVTTNERYSRVHSTVRFLFIIIIYYYFFVCIYTLLYFALTGSARQICALLKLISSLTSMLILQSKLNLQS